MIQYDIGIDSINWNSLFDLYELTNGVIGLAKKKEHHRIIAAFQSSYKVVVARHKNKVVGCARLISDGQCYGWVHDMAVHPECRRQGIGSKLVKHLLGGNEHLLIGLTSSFEAVEFYRSLHFRKHKTGMAKYPGNSIYLEDE